MRDSVKPLRSRASDDLIIDKAMTTSELGFAATFLDSRALSLIYQLSALTGIEAVKWKALIWSYVGLPADSHLQTLLRSTLKGWLPALKAGYRVCKPSEPDFAAIPHTATVSNQGPDLEQGRWLLVFDIVVGPLHGTRLPLSVTERLAAILLYRAVGPRLVQALPRPRPYDLHKMQVLLGLQEQDGRYNIRRIFSCPKSNDSNRKRMRRYVSPCLKQPQRQCFDCGADISECELSRHDTHLGKGECAACATSRFRLNKKGVCTGCVQIQMESGMPFQVLTNKD